MAKLVKNGRIMHIYVLDKGIPAESRGRKTTDLRGKNPRIAELPT